jgi:hypothetical protein
VDCWGQSRRWSAGEAEGGRVAFLGLVQYYAVETARAEPR